jgi:hypothetical protein
MREKIGGWDKEGKGGSIHTRVLSRVGGEGVVQQRDSRAVAQGAVVVLRAEISIQVCAKN